ncbi:DUF563 domain-containing protein [Roseomonas sp. CECT 9278]|uniref:glycosyltransferase family 61 protein n=1 Tax=Roseomonas sp. CECT 9278 TaxID=2845823 RepID=UPI001E4CDD10|nr:glycosyltransferase family 61 protein [Roseomonas sp. CECT 9278]CAH0148669.1 hypothetical protein ROS9278_00662 [Roseomonas sp. CECT 9278]
MDKEVPPPPAAPADKALREAHLAAVATLRKAAARGDGATVVGLSRQLDPMKVGPGIVAAVVSAALLEGRERDVAHATGFAIAAQILPRLRVTIAWQLTNSGHVLEGLAVLMADSATLAPVPGDDGASLPVLLRMLQRAAHTATVPPPLRAATAALARRMLGAADRKPEPTAIPFGPPGPRAPLAGPPTIIRAAPGLPAPVAEEAARAMAAFEAKAAEIARPEVSVLRNVFVDRRGLVWDRDGRPVMTYQQPVPPAGLAAMAAAPSVKAAVLAVEPHGNLYHWFAEWLPSLAWRLNDAAGTLPILLSDRAPVFVEESLDLADAGAAPRIAVGDALFVEELFVGGRNLSFLVHGAAYGGLLERIAARAEAMADPAMAGGPVYVSRRDSPKRPMGEEAALEAALVERGFDCLLFAQMTLADKIARLRRAPRVVAPHGAGLALLLAARPGTQVVEVIPATRAAITLRSCFAMISRIVGHRHVMWLERPELVGAAWAVDVPGVLAEIDAAGG